MLGTWSPEVIEGANRLVMKCACIDNLETCEEKNNLFGSTIVNVQMVIILTLLFILVQIHLQNRGPS